MRYSGVSIGYQLASIFAGGLAPIIAVELLKRSGGSDCWSRVVRARLLDYITIVAVLAYRETSDRTSPSTAS